MTAESKSSISAVGRAGGLSHEIIINPRHHPHDGVEACSRELQQDALQPGMMCARPHCHVSRRGGERPRPIPAHVEVLQ